MNTKFYQYLQYLILTWHRVQFVFVELQDVLVLVSTCYYGKEDLLCRHTLYEQLQKDSKE